MALLKKTLVVGFVLFGIIPLIHACWLMNTDKAQCKDYLDYSWHPHGSTWTNQYCVTCTCNPGYMVCCSEFPKSVDPGCTLQKDYKTCKYTVVKSKPSVECKLNYR